MIHIENLGKSYTLHHEANRPRYNSLRESIMDSLGRMVRPRRAGEAVATTEEFWALKDITFDVEEGEAVGLIGHNGAGKSTLLKVLSRITEPTRGRVRMKGRVASLLEVGTGFHPELTGRENIYLNGAVLGMSRHEIRARYDQIVEFAGVERFLDTPVKRYSSGMYVRLAFAVAAYLNPEILIVDEVLAVGDAAFQQKCLDHMKELIASGDKTILFVSHNMATVRLLCSRAILLEKGELVSQGSAGDVIDGYMRRAIERSLSGRESYSEVSRVGMRQARAVLMPTASGGLDLVVSVELFGAPAPPTGIGISIVADNGTIASRQGSVFTHFTISPGQLGTFTLRDAQKALTPGTYLVRFWLLRDHQVLLNEDAATSFEVPPFDPYGNGRFFTQREHGVVPMIWEYGTSPAAEKSGGEAVRP